MTQIRSDTTILGRYAPVRVLKDGAGFRTVVAIDVDGTQVVVKVAAPTGTEQEHLLIEHEATSLGRISSPWIAELLDYGWDSDGFSLITRYIDGVALDGRVGSPIPAADVVALAIALMSALRDAHQAGVIHRDIKPSNIITNLGARIEHATLVDFGLARSEQLDAALREASVGTALYMAPEQSGLLERVVDERADLYSLGVVLYECLSGSPPFTGSSLGDVLRQHATSKPPSLRELGVDVPRALAEIVERLLAKDPRDRYQSAEGAIADLVQIKSALDRGETDPAVVVGVRDRRHTLAEPAFVGRRQEIELLHTELDRARSGHGRVVLIEAESGGGKTRLLNEFAQRSALTGARIFRGQGIDQGAQRPFEVMRGVGHAIAVASDDLAFIDRIEHALGVRKDAAAGALPELADALDAHALEAGPEEFGEQRAIEALDVLLTSVGTPDQPAVIILDDCQWADELTLKLLNRWHSHRADERRNVLIAVAFRSEEVGPGHLLRSIDDPMRLELEPLSTDEVRLLVESMAGPVPDEAIKVVVELAEGSPFMASAVLRGLVESRALIDSPDGWVVAPEALSDAGASRRAGAFLARRIELLSENTRRLLESGAVLGKQFDVSLVAELAGHSTHDALTALLEARKRHMIWVRGTSCSFVHDKVRETILNGLQDSCRVELHRRAAERIESIDPSRSFEIAYHLDAAGQSDRALPFAISAAEAARDGHALASAQANYEIAERGSINTEQTTRLVVLEGLGDVLMLRGLYTDAADRFGQAEAVAEDPLARARIGGKVGELAFKRGDVGEGTRALERALATLGRRVPRNFTTMLAAMFWQIAVQFAHTYAPRLIRRRKESKKASDMLSCDLYDKLAYAYWFHRGPFHAMWTHLHGLNLAERYTTTPQLAKATSTHVAAFSIIVPLFHQRTVRFAERSLRMWREIGDLWGEGQAFAFYGVSLYSVAKYEECIDRMRDAVRLLEQTGDRWEATTAAWHMAYAAYRLGDRETAIEGARHVHRVGVEIGDAQARGISLSAWSKASAGNLPADLVRAELERAHDDIHTSAELANAEGIRLLAEGDVDRANDVFDKAMAKLREAKAIQVYVAPLFVWRTVARRHRAEQLSIYERGRSREALRAWRRSARHTAIIARLYPNERADGWREVALAHAAMGRAAAAQRAFARSLEAAERYEMKLERIATLRARAETAKALGWSGAAADLAALEHAADPAEQTNSADVVTASLVDRFDSILEQGRHIASALTKDAVWAGVRNAAMTLLRAERCVVVELKDTDDGVGTLVPVSGSLTSDLGTSVAWTAIDSGVPITVSEDDAVGDVSESLVLAGVRSSLAAPIFVRGRAAACFYVDHRGVGGLFGPDEERIAGFIAAIAGAAVENAEGFAEVQDLTRTLEGRVTERTGELADANTRLESTLADLRRLDQLKTEFMAMTAHDLRTPITVISGFASTLRERWDAFNDTQKVDFFDRIYSNTRRLGEFVENLLHFARIESGEFSYDLQPFDLVELTTRTATEHVDGLGGSRVDVHRAGMLPLALGDTQRTWQVLSNLLSNALKFSAPDSRVSVDIRQHEGELEVTVRDKGAGISLADQAKLFKKFSRIPAANGEKGPLGTGLGLYICKSIVESQGGRLWVMSAPGEGSTFGFTLPVAPA